jgi:alpha-glucosidase
VDAGHHQRNVARQQSDPDSVLNAARAFLRWRRGQPALVLGSIAFLDTPDPLLAFVREHQGRRMLAVFNLSKDARDWTLPDGLSPRWLDAPGPVAGVADAARLSLPPHAVAFAELGG